jgi:hypothetical protein
VESGPIPASARPGWLFKFSAEAMLISVVTTLYNSSPYVDTTPAAAGAGALGNGMIAVGSTSVEIVPRSAPIAAPQNGDGAKPADVRPADQGATGDLSGSSASVSEPRHA